MRIQKGGHFNLNLEGSFCFFFFAFLEEEMDNGV
jgi:hypothetical protein